MLTSFAIIFLTALLLGSICKKIKLPPLLGMLIVGIVFSPYLLNIISPSIMAISPDIRQFALIIILTRAGLSLNFSELKKNNKSAILLCFIPAVFEIAGYMLFGVLLLCLDVANAALLGTVMAAVSPAVIVPRMLKIQEQGFGTEKGIPQMITAGASIDDVFVIILFTAFLGMAEGGNFSWGFLWQTPLSIILGIGMGFLFGHLFSAFFKKTKIQETTKVILLVSFSFLFITLENLINKWIPYASLLSIISMAAILFKKQKECAKGLSSKYSKLWVAAEILLFVLVGAAVDIKYVLYSADKIIVVMMLAMIFRIIGVYACMIGSKLNQKERLFCAIAYTPKATVQAAIGAIPLASGLASGNIILATAVLAILITAPLGAFFIDLSYKKLLSTAQQHQIKKEDKKSPPASGCKAATSGEEQAVQKAMLFDEVKNEQ